MSIGELADAAGLTRRAIRFYVQRGLLRPPHGRGRGSEYDRGHLQRIERIRELQAAGHSLDAIRRILAGEPVAPPLAPPPRRAARTVMTAELLTRVRIADGVELAFDATRFQPDVADLMAARDTIRRLLRLGCHDTQQNERTEHERGT